MNTALLAYAIRWGVVSGLTVLGLSADSAHRAEPALIGYVGYLKAQSDKPYARFLEAVRTHQPQLLQRARIEYIEGSDADTQQTERAVSQAVARGARVIVAPTGASALAASRAASSAAVVFASYEDPVRGGFVRSLREPGGRITGVSLADELDGKRLELLKDAFPGVHSVAVLTDGEWLSLTDGQARVDRHARRLGLTASIVRVDTVEQLEARLLSKDAERFDAWYVTHTYVTYLAGQRIGSLLARVGKPAIYCTTEAVVAGGLIGYAQDTSFVWPTLAELVARVQSGEPAGSIPVERPRRFVLAVRTDAALPQVAPSVVRRADAVY